MRKVRSQSKPHRRRPAGLRIESLEDRRLLAVTFEFNYGNGSIGFNDPQLGASRREAIERAGAELGALFDHDATIEVDVTSSSSSGLAAASARFGSNPPLSGGFYAGIPQQKIITGVDANAAASDATMTVFFGGTSWYTGTGTTPSGSYDMVAIMKHELMHTLGFASGVTENGSDEWGNARGAAGSIWDPFDQFLSDVDGNRIIDATTYQIDLGLWFQTSTGGTSPTAGLFFNGPNAVLANGGQPVGLYSPGAWLQGSSGSHLDTNNSSFSDRTHLMVHAFGTGTVTREPNAVEIAMLADLGYDMDVGSVDPDPAGFTLVSTASSVDEGDEITFSVVLDAAPTTDVVIDVSSADTSEISAQPTTLTFTSQNWNQSQTVTLSGVADGVIDGDQMTEIAVGINALASDDAFDELDAQSLTITTIDTM